MFTKWADAKAVQATPISTRRTMAVGERMLLVEWTMLKGAEVPLHSHEYEQIGYVVAGAIQFTVDDQTQRLDAGDGYVAPSGANHSAVALEDSKVVDIFAPVRPDYAE